ncbi:MAG: hypothetical protein JWR26_649 [Pedosphaera sp.]|nr:hypothetical protein [Pedosphaera sp.]
MDYNENPESCITTVNSEGVPYNERLKRIRESKRKSVEELAELLLMTPSEYEEWESHPGELTSAISLGELVELASVLDVSTAFIFEGKKPTGKEISLDELCAKMNAHLSSTGKTIEEFEDEVGFEMEPSLNESSEIINWNVDCLRFVCEEIGVDWLLALP